MDAQVVAERASDEGHRRDRAVHVDGLTLGDPGLDGGPGVETELGRQADEDPTGPQHLGLQFGNAARLGDEGAEQRLASGEAIAVPDRLPADHRAHRHGHEAIHHRGVGKDHLGAPLPRLGHRVRSVRHGRIERGQPACELLGIHRLAPSSGSRRDVRRLAGMLCD